MAVSEFGIIERFFTRQANKNSSTQLGIGDDCALLTIPDGYELAVTTDTMVENVHFFENVNPAWLGHKLLAVNLSDLAAMGAKPIAVTLALTLPHADETWLQHFAQGFLQLAERYSVDLIGGDTTAGPLTLTVQAMGLVATGQAMRRSEAKPGDGVYVTGTLGDAGLGLKIEQGIFQHDSLAVSERFHRPEPRVNAGLVIREYATACIDLSDGLVSDLGHILDKSAVGVCLDWQHLPFSKAVSDYIQQTDDWMMPLISGEDYELCFTVVPEQETVFASCLDQLDCCCHRIGVIEQLPGLRLKKYGAVETLLIKGYEHFK